MNKTLLQVFMIVFLSLSLAANVTADLIIKSRYAANFDTGKKKNSPRSHERMIYFKGARQREDKGDGAIIYQCDLKQFVWFNDKLKFYIIDSLATVTPEERAEHEAFLKKEQEKKLRGERARAHGHGGVLTITITTTDTGERRQMFGYTARHILTKTIREASPGACQQDEFYQETDGWYIDLLYGVECSSDLSGAEGIPDEIRSTTEGHYFPMPGRYVKRFPKPHKGCSGTGYEDEVHFKRIGSARFGYPLSLMLKTKQKDTELSISNYEVMDIVNTELDQSLFEIPAGHAVLPIKRK